MISNILKAAAALTLGVALAGGAYAQGKMSDDKGGNINNMSKTSSDKMAPPAGAMSKDSMSKDGNKDSKMSKDNMSKDKMAK